MRALDDDQVAAALPWGELIEAIERVMVEPAAVAPARTAHVVPDANGNDATFLMKPGWITGELIAVKCVTVCPDNGAIDLPMVQAGVLLFDGRTGSVVGACEANELTTRRTAAASAVAAKRLARPDSRHLLVVGSGALASKAVLAHAFVRDYSTVEVWGRDPDKASVVVDQVASEGVAASVSADLDTSVEAADVISCVTGATTPLVKGELLTPGSHLDLVGGFNFDTRESDDDAVLRSTVFVDTHEDAVLAGDLAQPLADGVISTSDIAGDLADLVAGRHPGRTADDEITLFKSAGTALEDVAAAQLVFGIDQ